MTQIGIIYTITQWFFKGYSMKIGDKISAAIKSTSAQHLIISSEEMTCEINFPNKGRHKCYLAKNNNDLEYLVIYDHKNERWISSHHRTINSLREIETDDGNFVMKNKSLCDRVDAALSLKPGD